MSQSLVKVEVVDDSEKVDEDNVNTNMMQISPTLI